jgi:hypothetical protein
MRTSKLKIKTITNSIQTTNKMNLINILMIKKLQIKKRKLILKISTIINNKHYPRHFMLINKKLNLNWTYKQLKKIFLI